MGVTFSGAATEFAAGVSSLEIDTPILSPALGAVSAYERNYSKRALANACFELRNCPQGSRNSKLNALAYKMGRLVVRGWIECGRVESYLLRCCEANGLLRMTASGSVGRHALSGMGLGVYSGFVWGNVRFRR